MREQLLSLEQQRRELEARMTAVKQRVRQDRPKTNWAQAVSNACYVVALLCLGGLFVTVVVAGVLNEGTKYPAAIILREAALGEAQRLAKAARLSVAGSEPRDERRCPSASSLIMARRIAPLKADDPWGRPYRVVCSGDGEPWVYSLGEDGIAHTADDIASGMPRSNFEALEELAR